MDDLPRGERGGEGEAEEEIVVRRRPRRPKEERRPEAQVTARDLVLDGDEEPDRLGEGPRRQREVDRPHAEAQAAQDVAEPRRERGADRKSTRLNSSHVRISYAVFCLKKKK